MWRMHDGDRVLTDAEWEVFSTGLDLLVDDIESDIADGQDDSDTAVPAFDRLTAEQKLALLADVASAVRDPAVPMPPHTAANEGAIMAVLVTFRDMLREEVEAGVPGQTALRECLLAAVANDESEAERLPERTDSRWQVWDDLHEVVVERMLWDDDFDMGDVFLDLPPDQGRAQLTLAGIDPAYFLETPAEPTEKGLTAARQVLARLMGLPVPDDDGLYPALVDQYHDLLVGPVTDEQTDTWVDNPWVEVIVQSEAGWECDFPTWQTEFAGTVPITAFQIDPTQASDPSELPGGMRVEHSGDGWVVRTDDGSFWCGVIDNCWTDDPDDDAPALTFSSEQDARIAFAQADRMYGERATRRAAAFDRLGISD